MNDQVGLKQVSEVGENGTVPMEESPVIESLGDPISSPLGSFQSLCNSQRSEEGMKGTRMIPYVPPLKENRVLQFEDTLSEMDHMSSNLIYESLPLEGKAGNLTDLTVGMVLAEKPPAWLPVIHVGLKHLIISQKPFRRKRRVNMMLGLKQRSLGLVKERE